MPQRSTAGPDSHPARAFATFAGANQRLGANLMPDLIAIGQGLASIKTLSDIAHTAFGLRDSAKLLEAKVEFNRQLFAVQTALATAQSEQAELTQAIHDLEKEIADLEAWDAEKEKYELKQISNVGTVAYMLKPDARGIEPPHWLCTNCYQNRKRGIIQYYGHIGASLHFRCSSCPAEYRTNGDRPRWI
jgi:cell division protein FtsB